MILHLGGDYIVPTKRIIMILDYKKAMENKDTMSFLKNMEKNAQKVVISESETKSIVIASFFDQYTMYYSPISSVTLQKRGKEVPKI